MLYGKDPPRGNGGKMKKRQRQMLEILHSSCQYITAGQLAEQLGCSARTVRSDIGELRSLLEGGGYGRLEAKGKQGYRLYLEPDGWERLVRDCETDRSAALLAQQLEGKYLVLDRVLRADTVRISALEQEMFTTYKNVSRCVDQAESWLYGQGVTLLRRRGQGISAEGSRHRIRLAQWALYYEIAPLLRRTGGAEPLQSFWHEINLYGVRQTVEKLEKKWAFRFSYDGYERFSFLLCAMLADSRRKYQYVYPLGRPDTAGWEYQAAGDALAWMRDWYHAALPESEADFLWAALASSEIMDLRTPEAQARELAEKQRPLALVRGLIRMIGGILQRNFSDDETLEYGLLHYLSALQMALSIGDRTGERGRMFQDRADYADVTVACWSAGHLLEDYLGAAVTEWEVAVIASHFAGAVERRNVGGVVYVVCSYGVGVSRFLCEQLKRAFPQVQVMDAISPRELGQLRAAPEHCDLLVTTVELPDLPAETTVRIGGRLTPKDIEQIDKKLARLNRLGRQAHIPPDKRPLYPLFAPELIVRRDGRVEKDRLLCELSQLLTAQGCVAGGFAESVLAREQNSSTALSARVAIPHGLPEHVKTSRIAVALLDRPIPWSGSETADTVFLLALNFHSEAGVKESVIRFYRELITLVNEPERLDALHRLPDAAAVAQHLNALLQGGA